MANKNAVGNALTGLTGTGTFVGSTSPTFVTPTLGAASATSITFSSTSGIIGTSTNNNAASGSVGEIISSTVPSTSSVSFTDSVIKDLTSVSLTAGDWDIQGKITVSGTVISSMALWISTTSATIPDGSLYNLGFGNGVTSQVGSSAPMIRLSLSTTTTVYISALCQGTGSLTCCGNVIARRRR